MTTTIILLVLLYVVLLLAGGWVTAIYFTLRRATRPLRTPPAVAPPAPTGEFSGSGAMEWSRAGYGMTDPPDTCPVGGRADRCCTFSFHWPLCPAARAALARGYDPRQDPG